MTYNQLSIGQRIYNRGDMANVEHFGTITRLVPAGRFADVVEITPDEGSERGAYRISSAMISDVDLGHGGTRIVTVEARKAYLDKVIESMRDQMTHSGAMAIHPAEAIA